MTCSYCEGKYYARGLCSIHYQRWLKYGDPEFTLQPRRGTECQLPTCDRKHYSRGYCEAHYRRLYETGSVLNRFDSYELEVR